MKNKPKQANLMEHAFAMKVAYGMPQRDAYVEAFGLQMPKDPRETGMIDNRASRLAGREDIAALILDEQKLKGQRISAAERRMAESIRQRLGQDVMNAQESGNGLKATVLKGAELFLKSTGQYAPEEHILKNGGIAEGATFVPTGVAAMSEEDLRKIAGIGQAPVPGRLEEPARPGCREGEE